jgi:hypothetical protein
MSDAINQYRGLPVIRIAASQLHFRAREDDYEVNFDLGIHLESYFWIEVAGIGARCSGSNITEQPGEPTLRSQFKTRAVMEAVDDWSKKEGEV